MGASIEIEVSSTTRRIAIEREWDRGRFVGSLALLVSVGPTVVVRCARLVALIGTYGADRLPLLVGRFDKVGDLGIRLGLRRGVEQASKDLLARPITADLCSPGRTPLLRRCQARP